VAVACGRQRVLWLLHLMLHEMIRWWPVSVADRAWVGTRGAAARL